jgi:hypothetical protein
VGEALTDKQLQLARHALGLPNRDGISYRNHFCAGRGHADFNDWSEMVTAGLARRRGGNSLSGGDDVFWLTRDGATAALDRGETLGDEFR